MSVLLEQPASLVAYRPNKPTAMVVVADPRVRSTRHPPSVGARRARCHRSLVHRGGSSRIGNPRDICVADVHLPDGSGLTLLSGTRRRGLAQRTRALRRRRHRRGPQRAGRRGQGPRRHRHPAPTSGPPPDRAPPPGAAARRAPPPPGAPSHPGGYRELSGREVEVLRLVAEGQSNKAIGVSMGLSALTVKTTSPGSRASSARATGPAWWPWPCAPGSFTEARESTTGPTGHPLTHGPSTDPLTHGRPRARGPSLTPP